MPKKNTEKVVMKIPEKFEFDVSKIDVQSTYDPEMNGLLFKHLSQGLSFGSFDVGVSNKTLYHWLKIHPGFFLARERGEKKRLQLLEAAGMKMILAGNAVAWKFMMQDFGMTEKVELTLGQGHDDDSAIEAEMKNVTPERRKRIERIRELGRKLQIE